MALHGPPAADFRDQYDRFLGSMADPSHIGLISSNSLAVYMHQHVPDLTDHQQTPGMEVRFESTVFALAH